MLSVLLIQLLVRSHQESYNPSWKNEKVLKFIHNIQLGNMIAMVRFWNYFALYTKASSYEFSCFKYSLSKSIKMKFPYYAVPLHPTPWHPKITKQTINQLPTDHKWSISSCISTFPCGRGCVVIIKLKANLSSTSHLTSELEQSLAIS